MQITSNRNSPKITAEEHSKWREVVAELSTDYLTSSIKILDKSIVSVHHLYLIVKLRNLLIQEESRLGRFMSKGQIFTITNNILNLWSSYALMFMHLEELSAKMLELTGKMILLHTTFPDDTDNTICRWSLQDDALQVLPELVLILREVREELNSAIGSTKEILKFK